MLAGCDLSHHNGPTIDWTALAAALRTADGAGFVVHKASEADDYTDPLFAPRRDAAEGVGLGFGGYHFARLGDVSAEAARFLSVFGAPRVGEFVALDLEVSAAGVDPVAWTGQWLDAVAQRLGFEPMVYLNQAELFGLPWAPVVARNAGLWLAHYDGQTAVNGATGPWGTLAVKQFTDVGVLAGIPGQVDRDVFYGTAAQLAGYGFHGNVVVPPAPIAPPVAVVVPPVAPPVLTWRCQYGQTSAQIGRLQTWLAQNYPGYVATDRLPRMPLPATGFYGDTTTAWVRDFAHRCGIASSDGRNVGPQVAAALAAHGFTLA